MVRDEGGEWTPVSWQEYGRNVLNIAAALHKLGCGNNDKICILADNSLEWIYCGMAVMASGAVLVPVYSGSTTEQSAYILNHSDAQLVFVQNYESVEPMIQSDALPNLKYIVAMNGKTDDADIRQTLFTLNEFSTMGESALQADPGLQDVLEQEKEKDVIAQLLYTSGTTGPPKGVPLSYGNLFASTQDWLKINGPSIRKNSVDLHWLPNSHIFGWGSIGLGNILGFTSYLTNPMEVLELLPTLKPHLFMSVPLYYEKLYSIALLSSDKREEQLAFLRRLTGGRLSFLLSGGAGLKISIKEFFLDAGMFITEGYGLTECSPTLTMNEPGDYNFNSVGKPYPCVQLKLANDGEILAKGPVVFSGYYKDPEATKLAFTRDGWFKTGDLGEWLDSKYLQITGRKKEILVTTGGKNISAPNIESLFSDDPLIEHVVVYGDGRPFITAVITLRKDSVRRYLDEIHHESENAGLDHFPQAIHKYVDDKINEVNANLARYETIRKYFIAGTQFSPENGFLTASLKLRRNQVYENFQQQFNSLYER